MKNILNKFKIDFSTYLLLLIYFLCGYIKSALFILFIVIFHEIGHVIFSIIFNRKIIDVTIYSYGGITKSESYINSSLNEDLLIYFGGLIFQLLLSFLLNNFNILNYYDLLLFNRFNTYIFLFNILPIIPLDGYLIINNIINRFIPYFYSIYVSFFVSCIFLLFFVFFWKDNFVIIIFLIFNFIKYYRNINHYYNRFLLERYLYYFLYNGNIYIKDVSLRKLFRGKKCFFVTDKGILDEKEILAKRFDKS